MSDPVAPQNLDAEEHVLGAMMLSSKAIEAVAEILGDGAAFYRESHATIYRAAVALHVRGEPVDGITLTAELERQDELREIPGGSVRVNELSAIVPAASNAAHYAQIVAEKATARTLLREIEPLVEQAQNGGLDPAQATAALERALGAVDKGAIGNVLRISTLEEFVAVEEEGAAALLGAQDAALIPVGGDAMVYGTGGSGKTTLVVDLACHLAAGDHWLGIPVPQPCRVLLVENEGPRSFFRAKLERKVTAWAGSPLGGRVTVLEEPWGTLTLSDERDRAALAVAIREHQVDVVGIGPVTRAGMDEAGTLQEVRDFSLLLVDVRRRADRPVAFVLVHHENKGGQVSGAWEGAGDTLLHVQGQGHGRTRLYVQKARWSTSHHMTTLNLAWTDGEGFAIDDAAGERDDNTIADEILAVVLANGGTSWNSIEKEVAGKGDRKRAIRDRLLEGGRLINAGGKGGMKLWHADDPASPGTQEELRPDGDALGTHPASGSGGNADAASASLRPDVVGTQGAGTHPAPPSKEAEGTR